MDHFVITKNRMTKLDFRYNTGTILEFSHNVNTINENENTYSFSRIVTQHSFNRISTICNFQRETSSTKTLSNTLYLDLG